jgi:hypothetical protein
MLTDPVIHHHSGSKLNGATDKGPDGMRAFFASHTCNALCRRLGLQPGPGQAVVQQQQAPVWASAPAGPSESSAAPVTPSRRRAARRKPPAVPSAATRSPTTVFAEACTSSNSSPAPQPPDAHGGYSYGGYEYDSAEEAEYEPYHWQ